MPHINFSLLARCGDLSHYSTISNLLEGSVKVTLLAAFHPSPHHPRDEYRPVFNDKIDISFQFN
jgi:hypothetical protein